MAADAVVAVDRQGNGGFMDNFRLGIRKDKFFLYICFIERKPPDSVGRHTARIGFHQNPRGYFRLWFGVSQFFQDLRGIGCQCLVRDFCTHLEFSFFTRNFYW